MKKKLAMIAMFGTVALSTAAHANFGPPAGGPSVGRYVGLCDNYDNWRAPRSEGTPYWRPCFLI